MRQYEMNELVFRAPAPEGNAVAVDLQAEICEAGRTYNVKGFYAGNDTYKVRILPECTGTLTYKVSGIVEAEGSVQVEPADGAHHGVVRADGVHLRYADGTWCHTTGTTIYAMAHQSEEITEQTYEELAKGYFNKVRMSTWPKHYVYNKNEPAHMAFCKDESKEITFTDNLNAQVTTAPFDCTRPDYAFWEEFEAKLCRLFDMGIQVDLILFMPYDRWGHSHMDQANNLSYIDYAIRRLAAYPNIWWSMANEYDLFFDWKQEQWYEIDEFIAANDPYHHMLSNHNCFPMYDYERPAVTHVSLQSRCMTQVKELMRKYQKPVLYDECCYEGNLKETWGSISAQEMVNRFWMASVEGGYCTHGEVLLDDEIVTPEQQDEAVLWWAKGGKLKGQSPARIKFLRELLESLPGPLEPISGGMEEMAFMTPEQLEKMLEQMPEGIRGFIQRIASMDQTEALYHRVTDHNFAGHVGDQAYLFYYDRNCCARVVPNLPAGKTYRIEIIDAWNMTRELYDEAVTIECVGDRMSGAGCYEVRLPGREYMALLATVV